MRRPAGRPWVIAHRGASRAARENTVEAYILAGELGADAVELDVRQTSDGALVIHHDAVVDDVGPVGLLDAATLLRLAPHIPTFDEAIDACSGMWINVEIKNSPHDPGHDATLGIADAVAGHVTARGVHNDVVISSFHRPTVDRVHRIVPNVATGVLLEWGAPIVPALTAVAAAGHSAVIPHVAALTGRHAAIGIKAAHEAELDVICWTLDDGQEMRRLASLDLDGIITNVPDVALRALSAR